MRFGLFEALLYGLLDIGELRLALRYEFRCALDLRSQSIDIYLLATQARQNLLNLGNGLGVC